MVQFRLRSSGAGFVVGVWHAPGNSATHFVEAPQHQDGAQRSIHASRTWTGRQFQDQDDKDNNDNNANANAKFSN